MSRYEYDQQQVEDLFHAAFQVVRDATLAEGGGAYFAREEGFDALKASLDLRSLVCRDAAPEAS